MRQLELAGQLQLEFNEDQLALVSDGSDAIIDMPSVRCALRVYRSLPQSMLGTRFDQLTGTLAAMGLGIRVSIKQRTVASIGVGRKPSRILKALGFPPVTLHWGAALRSLLGF